MPTERYRRLLRAVYERAGRRAGRAVDAGEVAWDLGIEPSEVEFAVQLYERRGHLRRVEDTGGPLRVLVTEVGARHVEDLEAG